MRGVNSLVVVGVRVKVQVRITILDMVNGLLQSP